MSNQPGAGLSRSGKRNRARALGWVEKRLSEAVDALRLAHESTNDPRILKITRPFIQETTVADRLRSEARWIELHATSMEPGLLIAAADQIESDQHLRAVVEGLVEKLEGAERFDPEHDESQGSRWALGNDPIVMEPWQEGDWLRREDVLAALKQAKEALG